jgi:hypothetical protein
MLSLALVMCLGLSSLPQFVHAVDETAAWSLLSLDELLARLPPVNQESQRDPVTGQWVLVPAVEEMIRRLRSGAKLSDEQWRDTLLGTGALRFRPKWPGDRQYAVSMRIPAWLPGATLELFSNLSGVKTTRSDPPLTSRDETYGYLHGLRRVYYRQLGELAFGKHELMFDLSVRVSSISSGRRSRSEGIPDELTLPSGLLWKGPVMVEVEVVPTLDDVIPPVQNAEIDAAVRDSICVLFDEWTYGPPRVCSLSCPAPLELGGGGARYGGVRLVRDTQHHPILAHTALMLRIEIVERRETRETLKLLGRSLDDATVWNYEGARGSEYEVSASIPASIDSNPSAQRAWLLRVTGTADEVERVWHATQYWNGTIEIPLDEAIRRGAELAARTGIGPSTR